MTDICASDHPPASAIDTSPAWKALQAHYNEVQNLNIASDFETDSARFDTLSCDTDGVFFDYSKQRLTSRTIDLLCGLTNDCGLDAAKDALFSGEPVNTSENRPALHTALRDPDCDLVVGEEHIGDFIHATLSKMQNLSQDIRNGTYKGHTGEAITDIVNIGIGGSDLGLRLSYDAFQSQSAPDINVHFISSIDARNLISVLSTLNPATTLFVISSKTFSTQETLTNADTAKSWIADELEGSAISKHFIAVTSNTDAAIEFGVSESLILPLRDWIGGRYSIWSAIGFPLCVAYGFENFRQFLSGAHDMDTHFKEAPSHKNLPVLMALISIWNRNFQNLETQAVLPYAYDLKLLPTYLQQLEMESCGKSVSSNGVDLPFQTSPVLFGEQGPNAQHAFLQSLHQGKTITPCDFIGIITPGHDHYHHHEKLLANMIGQSQALMTGKSDAGAPHKNFPGNRPSSSLLVKRLDPFHLGMLLSAYEHKIFVQATIWGLNPFDQWGVELGKTLTNSILNSSTNPDVQQDASTRGLLDHIARFKV